MATRFQSHPSSPSRPIIVNYKHLLSLLLLLLLLITIVDLSSPSSQDNVSSSRFTPTIFYFIFFSLNYSFFSLYNVTSRLCFQELYLGVLLFFCLKRIS